MNKRMELEKWWKEEIKKIASISGNDLIEYIIEKEIEEDERFLKRVSKNDVYSL